MMKIDWMEDDGEQKKAPQKEKKCDTFFCLQSEKNALEHEDKQDLGYTGWPTQADPPWNETLYRGYKVPKDGMN